MVFTGHTTCHFAWLAITQEAKRSITETWTTANCHLIMSPKLPGDSTKLTALNVLPAPKIRTVCQLPPSLASLVFFAQAPLLLRCTASVLRLCFYITGSCSLLYLPYLPPFIKIIIIKSSLNINFFFNIHPSVTSPSQGTLFIYMYKH